jgi:Asp/Glu/hydantoin racemase
MTLAFLHTSPVLTPLFGDLAKRLLPGVNFFHIVDESLIKNTVAAGSLTRSTTRRIVSLMQLAHEGGADAVMLTCSSVGPAVVEARRLLDFPIFRVDEAMAEAAVKAGRRIGVAATLQTTLEPTVALIESTAADRGAGVEVIPRLSAGAFEAVMCGDTERHDRMVREMLEELAAEVDAVVLAQASMARVVPLVANSRAVILSSPELAVSSARDVLCGEAAKGRG